MASKNPIQTYIGRSGKRILVFSGMGLAGYYMLSGFSKSSNEGQANIYMTNAAKKGEKEYIPQTRVGSVAKVKEHQNSLPSYSPLEKRNRGEAASIGPSVFSDTSRQTKPYGEVFDKTDRTFRDSEKNTVWIYAAMNYHKGQEKDFRATKENITSRNSWNHLPYELWPQHVKDKQAKMEEEKKLKAREKFENEKKLGINPIPALDMLNKKLHDKSAYNPEIHGERMVGENKVITGAGSKFGPST